MLNLALRGTDPVVFFESQLLYDVGEQFEKGGVPTGYYEVPEGEPAVRRRGKDLTIATLGATLYTAMDDGEAPEGEVRARGRGHRPALHRAARLRRARRVGQEDRAAAPRQRRRRARLVPAHGRLDRADPGLRLPRRPGRRWSAAGTGSRRRRRWRSSTSRSATGSSTPSTSGWCRCRAMRLGRSRRRPSSRDGPERACSPTTRGRSDMSTIDELNHPSRGKRLAAAEAVGARIRSGELAVAQSPEVNNHVHTTYSFSPYHPGHGGLPGLPGRSQGGRHHGPRQRLRCRGDVGGGPSRSASPRPWASSCG